MLQRRQSRGSKNKKNDKLENSNHVHRSEENEENSINEFKQPQYPQPDKMVFRVFTSNLDDQKFKKPSSHVNINESINSLPNKAKLVINDVDNVAVASFLNDTVVQPSTIPTNLGLLDTNTGVISPYPIVIV